MLPNVLEVEVSEVGHFHIFREHRHERLDKVLPDALLLCEVCAIRLYPGIANLLDLRAYLNRFSLNAERSKVRRVSRSSSEDLPCREAACHAARSANKS